MKKGDKVRCLLISEKYEPYLTIGKVYEVIAGQGDEDLCPTTQNRNFPLNDDAMNIRDDDGDILYARFPSSAHGLFELVTA